MTALYIVGIVLALVVLSLVATGIWLRQLKQGRETALREQFPSPLLLSNARFFGQESRGAGQLRGNGTFVLTPNEVFFQLWLPKRDFRIPIASIQSIDTPKSHLGKTTFRPLLKITYQKENGQTDSMAWDVANLDHITQLLESTRK